MANDANNNGVENNERAKVMATSKERSRDARRGRQVLQKREEADRNMRQKRRRREGGRGGLSASILAFAAAVRRRRMRLRSSTPFAVVAREREVERGVAAEEGAADGCLRPRASLPEENERLRGGGGRWSAPARVPAGEERTSRWCDFPARNVAAAHS